MSEDTFTWPPHGIAQAAAPISMGDGDMHHGINRIKDSVPAPSAPAVRLQLDKLDRGMEELEDVVGELIKRLEPVLATGGADPNRPKDTVTAADTALSPLHGVLQHQTWRVKNLAERVLGTTASLTI